MAECDRPGKVANPARGQLNRKNEYFPVRVLASEFCPARQVRPSRPASSCSVSTLRLNLVLTHGIPHAFHGGVLFGGTLVIGLITEPLGFVQDAQDVMVLFDEWLAVVGLCSVRVLDEPSAGRDACIS